ncbi:hypothetical protein SCA03_40410 [Streptomyces cacaoi]|uniref:Uncharacterized protein n=1 Tax=Streptomyces cacaoi TaxID=1898 RepID=A0A4Y3R6E5_STRCI|nr:hypothetical protein SCA03_40410 [Streptomyces cacaoi]
MCGSESRAVPRAAVDAVEVAAYPGRARGRQRRAVVGLGGGRGEPFVGADDPGAGTGRVEEPRERHVQRDAERPEGSRAGIPEPASSWESVDFQRSCMRYGERRSGDSCATSR